MDLYYRKQCMRVWYDYLGKLEQYEGKRLVAFYISFTALLLQTSSKRNTFVLLELSNEVMPKLPTKGNSCQI